MRRLLPVALIVFAACSNTPDSTPIDGALPPFDAAAFESRLDESARPIVVNVWASWCIPCRSEAPLLTAAHEIHGDQVDFLGVAIQDTQTGAAEFLVEFGIPYENQFDLDADVRQVMGGSGIPITYFVAPGGDIVDTHFGIIDDNQLAIGIDELLAASR
jgi:thiol-disulfide isomerase/thioredoxin